MTGRPPIRVCIVLRQFPPEFGGHGIQIQRSLPYLEREGIEVTILSQRLDPEVHAVAPDPRVVRVLSHTSQTLSPVRSVLEMRGFLRREGARFDVLHSATSGWDFLLSIPLARRMGLGVVYEMIILDGNDPVALARSLGGGLKLRLLRGIDEWIGLSGVFRPRVADAGLPVDRFRPIPGGVETQRYRIRDIEERQALRERLGLPVDARIAVSVGAIIPRKGMDRLVAAWSHTRPRPGRDLLLLVGPSSDSRFAAALGHRIESPELKGTVRLVGRVENVEEYMGASDLFVFLSRREGLGYVTLEAMASGLPCIVSPLDGISDEIVVEGETGHIERDPDDAATVAARIQELLEDEDRRRAFGRAGRRVVEERFSMEARARALRRLYEELLERKGRSPGTYSASGT